MDINPDQDLEHETSTSNSYYTPLPSQSGPVGEIQISPTGHQRRRPISGIAGIVASGIFLMSLIALILKGPKSTPPPVVPSIIPSGADELRPEGRGVSQGVSGKSNGKLFDDDDSYNWTNAQLSWQRSAYHFQPAMNWMNDPNGPLYHMGWYHLFYQYNPDSAIWGNITWGHAVSTDMIHWLYLPIAMHPDSLFDLNGVWTGSATLLSDGQIIMLYTGDTDNNVQVQNLAYPANLSDPLLLNWDKYADNPVMVPPPGIGLKDFRDPTTAWLGPDGTTWRVIIGSKVNKTGIALIYQTTNFTSFDLLDGPLHGVPGTGMWECVDFYPVSVDGSNGLDTSTNGPGIKHVMKASMDDDRHDYYAIGTYDPVNDTWTPDNPEEDVGIGLRVDYGSYYASKTFYDQNKERRVLWGWAVETDSEADDIEKGWASLQTVPREVLYDNKTGANLLFWPIDEIENLRLNNTDFDNVMVAPGEVVPLDIGMATQLDISVEFVLDQETLNSTVDADVGYNCSGGAITRGALGPFGVLVLTEETLSELTPIYFYVARATDDTLNTYFCADETRSSKASSADTPTYGSKVTVLDDETLSMRLLVDHSIVESFAQGGRTVITSRIYPTEAVYGAAKVFLFNNATNVNVTASITIWQMDSAFIHPYPLDQI